MRNIVRPGRALGLVAVLVAAGCAGIQANKREPGTLANGVFTPKRPPAARYGPDPSRPCPSTVVMDLFTDELARAAKAAGKPAPQADGRLCSIADTLLGWSEEDAPKPAVTAFLSRYFGLPTPVQRVEITTVDTEEMKSIASQAAQQAQGFVLNAKAPRFGLATDRLKKASTRVVIVLDDAPIELEPVPRRLGASETAPIAGKVVGGSATRLVVSDAAGKVVETKGSGGAFRGEARCGDKPGRILVDVRGDESGPPVASFPIACATDLPASVALAGEAWPGTLADQERKMAELINAERTQAGLPALKWDDGLAKVARSAAESFRDGGGADLGRQIADAGIASPILLQNPGQGRSAAEAHQAFLASPQHRANIMSPEVNTFAVGLAESKAPDGTPTVFVSQLYVKELEPVDVEAARARLREEIGKRRAAGGGAAPIGDPSLDDLAQRYANALAAAEGNQVPQEKTRALENGLQAYKSVNVLTGAKADPLELANEPSLASGGKRMGIGVAQGKHPVLGRNASYVVVLTGEPREEKPASKPLKKGKQNLPRK